MANANMDTMGLYNKFRVVPDEAKKPIGAGRLKGFTDINPMWRLKVLTEAFGPCGIGWWYEITDKRIEGSGDEQRAFVDINLYYRYGDIESKAIPGTGGASFLTMERNGAYTSDECFKMALTDAISVAAKTLGVGADVYYEKDRDKYTTSEQPAPQRPAPPPQQPAPQQAPKQRKAPPPPDIAPEPLEAEDGCYYCQDCGQIISGVKLQNGHELSPKDVVLMSMKSFNGAQLCYHCGYARGHAGQ